MIASASLRWYPDAGKHILHPVMNRAAKLAPLDRLLPGSDPVDTLLGALDEVLRRQGVE